MDSVQEPENELSTISRKKKKRKNKNVDEMGTEDHVQEFNRQTNHHMSETESDKVGHKRESLKKKKRRNSNRSTSSNKDETAEENCVVGLKLMKTENLIESAYETVNDGDKNISMFRCSTCEFATDSKKRFMRHRAKHAFSCAECDFTAETARTVQEHFSRDHKRKGKYKCPECDLTNDSSWGLKMHMKAHSSYKPLLCELCNFSTRWPYALKRHVACTHPTDDSKRFHCNHCPYNTNAQSDFKRHTRVHSTIKPYFCSICPYKCKSTVGLRRHILTHVHDKKYACDFCEFTCAAVQNLTAHQKRIHSDSDKPYKCSLCSICFHEKSHLKKHEVVHFENKPSYKCSKCEKAFSWSYDCRQHEFKCARIAAYTCTVCNEGFRKRKHLRKHIVVHASL